METIMDRVLKTHARCEFCKRLVPKEDIRDGLCTGYRTGPEGLAKSGPGCYHTKGVVFTHLIKA